MGTGTHVPRRFLFSPNVGAGRALVRPRLFVQDAFLAKPAERVFVQSADFLCRSDFLCKAGVVQKIGFAQELQSLYKNYKRLHVSKIARFIGNSFSDATVLTCETLNGELRVPDGILSLP